MIIGCGDMDIPTNLRRHRIMGRNRREPCVCGHFHSSKEVIIPPNPKELLRVVSFGKTLWEEYPTEYVKNSPWGQIVIKKRPKTGEIEVY